jgi:Cu+-exporting ATPase
MVGSGVGAKRGILIKDGEALERAKKIDTVIFDKTGTITEGKPKVANVISCFPGIEAGQVLSLSASIEKFSEHPLAQTIFNEAKNKNLPLKEVYDFENHAGKGVRGKIENEIFLVGSKNFMREFGISTDNFKSKIEELENQGKTIILLAKNENLIGIIALADTLKQGAKEAVEKLSYAGIDTIIITGDNKLTADAIAKEVGIQKVFAEVLPQEKAEKIKILQDQGLKVAFVGDGINDAPALVQADLGIAIGTGTDIAIEAGNIVLIKGNPLKVVEALELARITFRTIKQNLFWAFFYNAAALPLAAFGLLNPMIASAAMAFSSLSVVGNSLRIKNKKFIILNDAINSKQP